MILSHRCLGNKNGPVLVLLHGFMGSTDDWQLLVNYLQSYCYLMLVDLPGHGDSLLGDCPGFIAFSHRLEVTLAKRGIQRCSLLGYSLGGRLAMAYSLEYPQRVATLLLEGAHPGLLLHADRQQRQRSDQQWADRFTSEPIQKVLQDWYQQPVFADLSAAQRYHLIEIRKHQSGQRLAKTIMAFSLSSQPDYRKHLQQRADSTVYLAGERDQKFSELGEALLHDRCISALRLISGSGHNVHREEPQKLAATILSIIKGGD